MPKLRLSIQRMFAIVTVLGLLMLPVAAHFRSRARVNESYQIGDRIIRAIEQYKSANGHYPARLDDISPDFIPKIDPPTFGSQAWKYSRFDDSGGWFNLSFQETDDSVVYYWQSRYGYWSIADIW